MELEPIRRQPEGRPDMAMATAPEKAPAANERKLRIRDPFDMFEDLQQEVTRLWGHRPLLMPRPLMRPLARMAESEWAPRVDVYEKNGDLVIKAELPGVRKEDIKLEIEGGDLVVRGERKAESEVREDNYYRIERTYGTFYRRLPIPFDAKPDQIKASYNDGILEIRVPKPPETAPEATTITVN
jgi:HSP20 family protein